MRVLAAQFDELAVTPKNVAMAATEIYTFDSSTYFQAGAFLELKPGSNNTIRPVPSGVTGTPVGIMPINAMTDSAGNITLGSPAGGNEWGANANITQAVWITGQFDTSQLVQSGAGQIRSQYFQRGNGAQCGTLKIGTTAAGTINLF